MWPEELVCNCTSLEVAQAGDWVVAPAGKDRSVGGKPRHQAQAGGGATPEGS